MFTTITVSEVFEPEQPGGPSPSGQVAITLSERITDGAGNEVDPSPIFATVTNGELSVELYANTDPTTSPAGSYYTVQFDLDEYPPQPTLRIVVPHNAATGKCTLSSIVTTSLG